MKHYYFLLVSALLLCSCGQTENTEKTDSTLDSQQKEAPAIAQNEPIETIEVNNDELICKAIKNFLLEKPNAAVLTASAKKDLAESTWPEVSCSVEGMLDMPSSFKDLTVTKVGEGKYKYSCVCPEHGDKFVDCCTIHATLGSDGVVKIEHVTWDK